MKRRNIIRAVDLFCGAGGASLGLVRACRKLGIPLDLLAINHWKTAVDTHELNHPGVKHRCQPIEDVNPSEAVPGGYLHILLAGPECTHHSNAAGGRPKNEQSRASAWHIIKWAQELYVDTILIENVPEFRNWGPLGRNLKPLKSKKGQTYKAFIATLRSLDYVVEERILNAADYGDPTTRRRLFIIARRGKSSIAWPAQTHSKTGVAPAGPTKRWKPAKDIIDWSIPGKSIFNRKKPLKPATIERILAGLEKFGGPDLRPFIVVLRNHADGRSVEQPLPTLAASGQHIALAEPALLGQHGGATLRPVSQPAPTVATGGAIALVEPCIVQCNERRDERTQSIEEPLRTITANGGRFFGLAEPYIVTPGGANLRQPRSVEDPIPTVTGSDRLAVAQPFLTKYNRTGRANSVDAPLDTISTRDRFALVQPVINGYALDIRFRMLQPHELAAAMSFPKAYTFTGTREEVVKQIGNAWPGELSFQLNYTLISTFARNRSRARKAA